MRNISKLMTFIFKNRTIFWDISKWNRGQKKWDQENILFNGINLNKFEFIIESIIPLPRYWSDNVTYFNLLL